MGVIPAKKDYKNLTYEDYLDFTEKVENSLGYTKVTHTPHSAKNHFDKYGYLNCGRKIVVVYDTKAKILSFTAPDAEMKKLSSIARSISQKGNSEKKSEKQTELGQKGVQKKTDQAKQPNSKSASQGKTATTQESKSVKKDKDALKKSKKTSSKEKQSQQQSITEKESKKDKKAKAKAQKEQERLAKEKQEKEKRAQEAEQKKKEDLDRKKRAKEEKLARHMQAQQRKEEKRKAKKQAEKQVSQSQEKPVQEEKTVKVTQGNYCLIKQCYPLTFTKAFHRIRNTQDLNINTLKTLNFGTIDQIDRYVVVKNGQESEIKYTKSSGTLEIFGQIIDDVKPYFIAFGANEVIDARTETDSKDGLYDDVLRSLMPTAIEFLSAQERTDLGAGYDELIKSKQHYEYSMFLLSPFKALENFIFDLQKSEGIVVKLIGQAYDKDDSGRYQLKECYRKKSGVVFSEVMSALYTEYYTTRNHYTHSGDGQVHQIKSKSQAIQVVSHMIQAIEYNCQKLKEINYKIKSR